MIEHPIELTTPIKTRAMESATVIGRAMVRNEWRYDLMYADRSISNNQPGYVISEVTGEPRSDIIRSPAVSPDKDAG